MLVEQLGDGVTGEPGKLNAGRFVQDPVNRIEETAGPREQTAKRTVKAGWIDDRRTGLDGLCAFSPCLEEVGVCVFEGIDE